MSHRPRRLRPASPPGDRPGTLLALLAVGAAAAALLFSPDLLPGAVLLAPLAAATGRPAVLDNDTRRLAYEQVRSHPGSTIAKAAEAADVSHSTATYHLETLSDAGLVVSMEDGNKRRFFPNAGAYDEAERRSLAVLENGTTRRLLAAIARSEPTYRSRLAEALDVSTPTVNWHLERLEACGFLAEPDPSSPRLVTLDRRRIRTVLGSLVEKLDETEYDAGPLAAILETLDESP